MSATETDYAARLCTPGNALALCRGNPCKGHVCDLCEDGGTDFTDGVYAYHRSCLVHRIANANNNRERRGLANSLEMGWTA